MTKEKREREREKRDNTNVYSICHCERCQGSKDNLSLATTAVGWPTCYYTVIFAVRTNSLLFSFLKHAQPSTTRPGSCKQRQGSIYRSSVPPHEPPGPLRLLGNLQHAANGNQCLPGVASGVCACGIAFLAFFGHQTRRRRDGSRGGSAAIRGSRPGPCAFPVSRAPGPGRAAGRGRRGVGGLL